MTWPLNGSEAGGDLVLIQTMLPFKGQVTKLTAVKLSIAFFCSGETGNLLCPASKTVNKL